MKENLLDGDLNSSQYRLLEEADSFDLEDFYLNEGLSTGGVCLITPNQMIMTDCYVKPSNSNSYGMHRETVDAIYKAIYSVDGPKNTREKSWQESIMDDGNIIIQLCSDETTLVWIPKEISPYQHELLEAFSNRINNIVSKNILHFEKNPIIFEYSIKNRAKSEAINNIDPIFNYIKVREEKNGKTI